MKIKTIGNRILFFFCLLTQTSQAQQSYPKLMSFIQGRIVQPRWEENETHYYDWKGDRLKDFSTPSGTYTIQYLFVDSTGKTINNEKFDKASGFFNGLAVIQKPSDYNHELPKQYAVLNESGEFVFPYTKKFIENMGGGFVKITSGDTTRIFDKQKKEIASCFKCVFSLSSTGRNIYQMPNPYSKDPQIIKLYDLKGKLLFEKPGYMIHYLTDNLIYDNEPHSHNMPYHIVKLDDSGRIFSIVSDKGELMLDSIDNFVFNQGISCISRNGKKGFAVDSMFRVIIPASFGHDRYWPLFTHPQKAFAAWRNDSVMVIDRENRLLIQPMAANYLEYNNNNQQYDIRNTATSDKWILSLGGDTISSPSRHFEFSELLPALPGALVRCKPTRLKGYVSDKGETIIPCKYEQLAYAGPKHFIFFTEKKAGYLDHRGKELLTVDSAISLSNFSEGYAIFGFKQPDYRYGGQRVIGSDYAYSIVYKMIDSTGKIISNRDYDEISKMHQGYCRVRLGTDVYLVNSQFEKVLSKEGHCLLSYFCKGTALAYNPTTNKIGLVNDKLETIVPVIYDWIDTEEDENRRYGFSIVDKSEHHVYSYGGNTCAKIIDGNVRVKIGEEEITVAVKKGGK